MSPLKINPLYSSKHSGSKNVQLWNAHSYRTAYNPFDTYQNRFTVRITQMVNAVNK